MQTVELIVQILPFIEKFIESKAFTDEIDDGACEKDSAPSKNEVH
jgi:hypothetical protein